MNSNLTVAIQTFAASVDKQHLVFAELRGITVIGMLILNELYKKDGQMPSELALSVGRAVTSFTPPLDALEKKGLICRRIHPKDRRAVQIFLTPEGEELRGAITIHMVEVEKWILNEMRDRLKRPMSPTLDTLFAPFST